MTPQPFFKKKEAKPIERILIIRFSSIGDIVLTTPVLRALRRAHPAAEIDFLVKENFKTVIAANPYVSKILVMQPGHINASINELRANKYDIIIDLQNNRRSNTIKRSLQGHSYTVDKLNIKKWLYTTFKINNMPPTSIVERYMAAAKHVGAVGDGGGLDYFIPEQDKTTPDDIPMGHWAGYVAAVIGGSFATKKMPSERWKEILAMMPYPTILLGGKEDMPAALEMMGENKDGKIYNACGKFNLNESAHLVHKAKVVISHDTGLMHVAAAFQKPIVAIWGNTTPWLGMFPYYGFNDLTKNIAQKLINIEIEKLNCRPCSKLGYNKCPKGHFKCMLNLSAAAIVQATVSLWEVEQKK